jgi:hypothetical protein
MLPITQGTEYFTRHAEGGTRPLPSAGVHQRAPSALSPTLSSTNVHSYPLLSAGYGVRKGVSEETDIGPRCSKREEREA